MGQDRELIKDLAEWLEAFIWKVCNIECEHCHKVLSYPHSGDIEKWLKGER